jgi:hypothetical protein
VTILLDPANPYDFSRDELEELAVEIRTHTPQVEVLPIFRPEDGYGGPWAEVLYIWHEAKEGIETAILLASAVKWMKRRWERDRIRHPDNPRSRSVMLIEDELVVRNIKIDLPNGEAVEETIDSRDPPHGRPSPED